MDNMKTSVLMSVYSKENPNHFDLSLKSLLIDQTLKPDEFVLICDGPLTEGLNKIIEKYQILFDDLLFVYRIEENVGLGRALNYGLDKCNYDIIIRADSDDISDPERIAIQLNYLKHNMEISVVSSYIDEFEIDYNKPTCVKTLPLTSKDIYNMAKFRNPINHMAVAFRKQDIINVGSYKHIPYVEDYELWVRTMINGYKLGNIDKVLVHARVGNGMVERRSNVKYLSSWKKLNKYMFENNMISQVERIRNIVGIYFFVYCPKSLKRLLYRYVLRKHI